MSNYLLLGFGFSGHWEILIIAFVILLLFGHRLPSLMRSLGRGVTEFKHGLHGEEDEPGSIENKGESRKVDESVPKTVSEK